MFYLQGVLKAVCYPSYHEQRFPIICDVFWNELATCNPDVCIAPQCLVSFERDFCMLCRAHAMASATHVSLWLFSPTCVSIDGCRTTMVSLPLSLRLPGAMVRPYGRLLAAGCFFLFWDGWDGNFLVMAVNGGTDDNQVRQSMGYKGRNRMHNHQPPTISSIWCRHARKYPKRNWYQDEYSHCEWSDSDW